MPYGQPQQQPYNQPSPYGQPPYGPPQFGPPQFGQAPGPASSSSPLKPLLIGAVLILVILGGIAAWALTQMDDPPIAIGRSTTPTAVPTPSVAPTATRAPGLGINIPGPQGTPTPLTIPLPIPGLGASPAIPGASGTAPPTAKLTADQAREKVKETLATCQLLQRQINLAQVTFDMPNWRVRLPLSGATWTVDDSSGAVTADERAADRARTCRI